MESQNPRRSWPDDRRDSYRLEVEDGEVRVEGRRAPAISVKNLSASGGGVVLHGGNPEDLTRGDLTMCLSNQAPFSAALVPVRKSPRHEPESVLGVKLHGLDRRALLALSRFLVSGFLEPGRSRAARGRRQGRRVPIVGASAVERCLSLHAVTLSRRLRVYLGPAGRTADLEVLRIDGRSRPARALARLLDDQDDALAEGRSYLCELPGGHALHTFSARVVRRGRSEVELELPEVLSRSGFRTSPRAPLTSDTTFEVRLSHPRLDALELAKPVLDVAAHGFSVPLDPEADLLVPGDHLAKVVLELPSGPIHGRAMLRSVSRSEDQETIRCGLELIDVPDPEQKELWNRFVFGQGHPRLELGGSASLEESWHVLVASGYLDETCAAPAEEMRRSYFAAWGNVAGRRDVARHFLLRDKGAAVGTLSANRVYPDTWLVHHLGIDRKVRGHDRGAFFDMAREMYLGNAYLLDHLARADHFLLYVDANKPWNDLMYGRFLREYPEKSEFIYDRFRVYRLDATSCIGLDDGPRGESRPTIERPDATSLRSIAARLRPLLPEIEREAFCYDAERLDLRDYTRRCESVDYERRRHLRVAVGDGGPEALLVAETGNTGLNLFGLLDRCWILPLTAEAVFPPQVRAALLEEARRIYCRAGRASALFVDGECEDGVPLLSAPGIEHVADGLRWLARRSILPSYLHYIEEFLASCREKERRRTPTSHDARGGA